MDTPYLSLFNKSNYRVSPNSDRGKVTETLNSIAGETAVAIHPNYTSLIYHNVLATLKTPPPNFFIPRVKDLRSLKKTVSSWRNGKLGTRNFTPLRLLQDSIQRQKAWDGYSN